MQSDRWKKASLAIDAMIRGLEQDQIEFHYDETACTEIASMTGGSAATGSDGRAEPIRTASSLLRELPPLKATTAVAYL